MANQYPLPHPDLRSSDTNLPADGPAAVHLTRRDSSSSTGSEKTIPKGYWRLNISGNCPGCGHHHNSVKIHVKVTSDSSHVGDVYCENCQRLWLGFGKRNSARISLISTATIEPDPLENTFRSALVHMIRSATAIAALSPNLGNTTLADIPESSSAGPSRETSVRSTSRNGVPETPSNTFRSAVAVPKESSNKSLEAWDVRTAVGSSALGDVSVSRCRTTRTPRFVLHVRQKIGAKFPILQSSPLRRWFPDKPELSPKQQGKQPVPESLPSRIPSPMYFSNAGGADTEMQNKIATEQKQDVINVCTSSTNSAEALDSLKAIDQRAIQELSPEQRIAWFREQLTDFRSRYAKPLPPTAVPAMVENGTQVDTPDILPVFQIPPSRRHSALAFVGNRFGSFEYWEIFRGSNSTLNGRPLSISEGHLSDADTAVEGMSVNSASHHVLVESLQRDRSPRPRSIHSVVQNWQHIHQNRLEARRSFDSAATGGNVRSITSARGRALNRLSRASGRASTIYVTEPSMSQAQLAQPTNEDAEQSSDQERHK